MTIAICMRCGDEKFGSFTSCKRCNFRPTTEDEMVWSVCVSDHHLNRETLSEIGEQIKAGNVPMIAPDTHKQMLEQLRKAGTMRKMGLSQPTDVKSKKVRLSILGRIIQMIRGK